jgi:2-methylcitrate dehydratase PrpD
MTTTDSRVRTLSERLTDFALGYRTEDIPPDVMRWAALRFVDTVGVGLACASYDLGTAATHVVLDNPAPGSSSVWASGGILARADDAALANGMLSHGMDYDDTHTSTTMHPSTVFVPTALALGEETGASGPDVLAAAVVGYEVAARLGLLSTGKFQMNGFHATSIIGIFGAVAIASRLTGLSTADGANAAGLAGSMASGLMAYLSDGSNAKQLHPGWAAHGAIDAVRLVRYGATGPAAVLEDSKGVFKSFARLDVDVDPVFDGLGEEWVGTRVATKPYPACHCVHAPVDAFRALRDRLGLNRDDIAGIRRITGLVPTWYLHLVCDPLEAKRRPRTVYEARFSLPYSVAVAAIDGQLGLASYEPDRLADSDVLDIASRVDYEVVEYPEFPAAFPGGIRVELADGTVEEEVLHYNVGSVGNPMSEEDIAAKFLGGAGRLGGEQESERLLAALQGLPLAASLREFTAAIAGIPSPFRR